MPQADGTPAEPNVLASGQELDIAEAHDSGAMPSEAFGGVEQELAAAEAWREHEALATAEGMPAGELDEDPLPPTAKSTAAGE